MQEHEIAQDLRDTPCPRCGAAASWRKLDLGGENVEIGCPDCGKFQMTREEFETQAAEVVEPEDESD